MKKRVSKPKVMMRLLWESRDSDYDKETKKRYSKIWRIVNKIPTKSFNKLITNNYEFYRGFCYSIEIKTFLDEVEFDILLAVVDNISSGYYEKRKN